MRQQAEAGTQVPLKYVSILRLLEFRVAISRVAASIAPAAACFAGVMVRSKKKRKGRKEASRPGPLMNSSPLTYLHLLHCHIFVSACPHLSINFYFELSYPHGVWYGMVL
jgi:hypothetical protein